MVVYYLNGGKALPTDGAKPGEEFTVADAAGIIPPDGMRFMNGTKAPKDTEHLTSRGYVMRL